MQQQFIQYKDYTLFQYARLQKKNNLLIFMPGLGDSFLNYQMFFELESLREFDIVVPDLLGHGKTGGAYAYSYAAVSQCFYQQLADVIREHKKVILIPHSVAGIPATMLCQTDLANHISGVFALETSITQYGSFITENLTKSLASGESFADWFAKLKDSVFQQGVENEILRFYYAGLELVRSEAFLQLGLETRQIATENNCGSFTNSSGLAFVNLDIPKVYCFGDKGNQQKSIPFLQENHIPMIKLTTNLHSLHAMERRS